jgi:protein SCO1/2
MRIIRYAAWAAVAALALVTAILFSVSGEFQNSGTAQAASIGGPFTLTTQDGKRLSSEDLKGKPFAIFFGFTLCPEVCPTTLTDLTDAIKKMGADADRMNFLFVTVDPERDTQKQLKDYLSSFDPRFIGLTGTPEEIAAAAKAYRVTYEKVPTSGGDYTMNHTALVYLMDAQGNFKSVLAFGMDPDRRVQMLENLVNGTSS